MSLPLLLSLLALLVGPVLYRRARYGRAAAALDAFALVGVSGLVLAHILPQSFGLAGWVTLPVAVAGLVGPGLLCGSRLLAGRSSLRLTLPLALGGIALHALLDGIALGGGEGRSDVLGLAVVLHRVPVGLGVWWLARPAYGARAAQGLLATIALFTVLGYAFGDVLVGGASETWLALVQALIAGSLLHVVLRHPPGAPAGAVGEGRRLASGVGGLAGILLVVWLEGWHRAAGPSGHVHAAWDGFLELLLESAPALLLAYLAVAAVHGLRLDLSALLGGGSTLGQALRGTFIGLPIPICSCGVVPLYRSLVQQRVPPTAGMSFLVATPELGIAALFLSWQLLGGQITLARTASAVVLALVVGILVGRHARVAADVPLVAPAGGERPPLLERAREGLRYGFGDMVDGTAPWILVGILLAAVLGPLLSAEELARLPGWAGVPLFALAGLPLYVCASGSTPLAAVLIAQGASPGAAIAFLLTGPATNVTTFGLLARLHDRRIALAFAGTVAATTVALGYGIDAVLGGGAGAGLVPLGEHHGGTLQWLALAALAVLFLASFLRQGTRGFVAQVITPHGRDHDHDHDHGEHAHDGHDACACPGVPAPVRAGP